MLVCQRTTWERKALLNLVLDTIPGAYFRRCLCLKYTSDSINISKQWATGNLHIPIKHINQISTWSEVLLPPRIAENIQNVWANPKIMDTRNFTAKFLIMISFLWLTCFFLVEAEAYTFESTSKCNSRVIIFLVESRFCFAAAQWTS